MPDEKQLNGSDLYKRQSRNTKLNAPVIVCDGLQTPENLGSILRVADAIGSARIILLDNQIDLSNKKISKIARSTDKHISLDSLSFNEFINIRNQFNHLYALEITSHSIDVFKSDISSCDAILIGHESRGIRDEALALCTGSFHLPMYGINGSMNISHALSVFLYEWRRQHQLS
ncbi:MAG: hypothetical protein DIZ80_10085 [endosymbiont of Galathealinum brachiosum]|uniref:tRNA/rRNA methyltransferase SpoU type domain-containing protein n=1 Tax=endosymbiont of Galathealinum brachiosum TaxID=2200906 RepID=A0A370DCI1_9GAMM|nr:MAG: hypothetical protein DIZ80_10085 [endosymbiont of Galathealinum brachiosum]